MKILMTLCLAALAFPAMAGRLCEHPLPLPDHEPFVKSGAPAKVLPKLESGTFPFHKDGRDRTLDYAALVCGNKEVAFRRIGTQLRGGDLSVAVNVDGRNKVRMTFLPCWHMQAEKCVVTADDANGTASMTMPYVSDETKQPETLLVTLAPDGPNRVKVSWSSSEQGSMLYVSCTDDQPVGKLNPTSIYRGKKVTVGGTDCIQRSREELLAAEHHRINVLMAGDFTCDADRPLGAVTVGTGALAGDQTLQESLEIVDGDTVDRWQLQLIRRVAKTGSLLIDLHEVAKPQRNTPPPVGGIDFFKSDGFHYAKSPTRNSFRNPSFERGLLYWDYTGGGANFNLAEDPVRYAVETGGLFGAHCLHLRPFNCGVQGIRTFPMSLDAGKRYTLSCYVKPAHDQTVKLAIQNAARGGPIKTDGPWGDSGPDSRFAVRAADGWTRIRRTFAGDAYGLIVHIGASDCLFDGFQLEEGEDATAFVAPPLDIALDTGWRDNYVYAKDSLDLRLAVSGAKTVRADVMMTVSDIYGKVVFRRRLANVGPGETVIARRVAGPLLGPFLVRYDITPKAPGAVRCGTYTQYERFTVVDPLENRHATKDLFACFAHTDLQSRGEDRQRRLMEWGFGSTTWIGPKRYMEPGNALHVLFPKYRFNNLVSSQLANYADLLFPDEADAGKRMRRLRYELTDFTPEQLQIIENAAYEALKDVPPEAFPVVAFENEEESSPMINGATDGGVAWGKAQFAFYRGAKRANPKFMVAPTHGTSGWSKLRGRKAYEQYLNAANLNGFKYDAVAVHPYGNGDGGTLGREDADVEIQYMQKLLGKYGYDPLKTPIYLTEAYNHTVAYVPEWNCGPLSQDGYPWGKTGYDFGNREYQDACQVARMYLVTMKHWPQVRCLHCWLAPTIDAELRPRACAMAVNAIGRFLPNPEFAGEAHPVGGVRAYVWKQGDGAVAAIWSVNTEAEMGRGKCPKVNVSFSQKVRFFDMMGNECRPPAPEDGVQLTSAPLYIRAADAARLVADLRRAYSTDAAACLKLVFAPDGTGAVKARIRNLTDREQKGKLHVNGKKYAYAVPALGETAVGVDAVPVAAESSRTYSWKLVPANGGKPAAGEWELSALFAKKCGARPDWSKIPARPFSSWFGMRPSDAADASASYRLGWNEKSLFIRIDVRDSKFIASEDVWKRANFRQNLYGADGSLEVYLDCGANGRANAIRDYDDDDYRYDFAPPVGNGAGRAHVWRFVEVDHQLADGINMPTKEECAAKIRCDFTPTADGFAYELTLDQRYVEPILLSEGAAFGLGLFVHDYDDPSRPSKGKGISNCVRPAVEAQHNPHLWPTVVLTK